MSSENKKDVQEDLDAFLTSVESKLRGPFSSLDLAKAISTTALRGSLTPKEYLKKISLVLSRTDKAIQSRILLGLLGLDPSEETDKEIWNLLTQAQEAPLHEEWVRTVSGLIQGIMFQDHPDSPKGSCQGEEAKQLLQKTSADIVERVQEVVQECSENEMKEKKRNGKTSLQSSADMNAFFAPFYYSMLPSHVLREVIPECNFNSHFAVDESAKVLRIDEKLEAEKAREEQEHKQNLPQGLDGKDLARKGAQGATDLAAELPPGFRPTKLTSKAKTPASKASMFMPAKRTVASRVGVAKTGLHTRRAGAAQSLLAKNRMKQRLAGTPATGTAASKLGGGTTAAAGRIGGRAGKLLANNRSKMKMIETSEVDTLNKEHQARDDKLAEAEKLKSRKRKIFEAAAQRGLVGSKSKKMETANGGTTTPSAGATQNGDDMNHNAATSESGPTNEGNGTDTAETNKESYDPLSMKGSTGLQAQIDPHNPLQPGAVGLAPDAQLLLQQQQQQLDLQQHEANKQQKDWHVLLNERSNKLSADDRLRVKQFFEDHYNPNPEEPVYKMKLHEARTTDPATGQPIKETFYLELDYRTFTSRQSKKVKRY